MHINTGTLSLTSGHKYGNADLQSRAHSHTHRQCQGKQRHTRLCQGCFVCLSARDPMCVCLAEGLWCLSMWPCVFVADLAVPLCVWGQLRHIAIVIVPRTICTVGNLHSSPHPQRGRPLRGARLDLGITAVAVTMGLSGHRLQVFSTFLCVCVQNVCLPHTVSSSVFNHVPLIVCLSVTEGLLLLISVYL